MGRESVTILMICFRWAFASSKTAKRIVVTLRHFFAVGARYAGRVFEHVFLRHEEHFAEFVVETSSEVSADFDVLHLVLADGTVSLS